MRLDHTAGDVGGKTEGMADDRAGAAAYETSHRTGGAIIGRTGRTPRVVDGMGPKKPKKRQQLHQAKALLVGQVVVHRSN